MSYTERIRKIKADIIQQRDAHYALNGFIPITKKYQSRKQRENDNNYHLKQLCKHLKLKGPQVVDRTNINIIDDDIFHCVQSTAKRIIWKELDNELRIEYIENYMSCCELDPPLNDQIKLEIIELLQNGKLIRKSDVQFDEVNAMVVCIKVLKYDEDNDNYYINLQQQIARKKRNQRLKKLFS